ncbi:MAG: FkbM family methyltransferase [SAR324 cluster bacterium]|nr:FkbM family methyltransferase [SAR324 cluster bacterium]
MKQRIKARILYKTSQIKRLYKIRIKRDPFLRAYQQWVKDKGDRTLRLDYPLNESSVVFDVGGYEGDFAQKIFDRYQCNVYIFEPVKSFYEEITTKFKGNDKIKVFNFGLSNQDGSLEINLSADGSSVFAQSKIQETIVLKDIVAFIKEEKVEQIDLIKINVEGGEFQILPALINGDFAKRILNFQVQFHTFIENAEEQREEIRRQLSQTHQLTYDYWFIWENWERKS